jgi:hypothetical protein
MEHFPIPSDPILAAIVEKFNEMIDLMAQDEKPSFVDFDKLATNLTTLVDLVPRIMIALGRQEACYSEVDPMAISCLAKEIANFYKRYDYSEINASYTDSSIATLRGMGMSQATIENRVNKIVTEGLYMKVVYPEIREDETEAESRWSRIDASRSNPDIMNEESLDNPNPEGY